LTLRAGRPHTETAMNAAHVRRTLHLLMQLQMPMRLHGGCGECSG
jgi:hypothetical protein